MRIPQRWRWHTLLISSCAPIISHLHQRQSRNCRRKNYFDTLRSFFSCATIIFLSIPAEGKGHGSAVAKIISYRHQRQCRLNIQQSIQSEALQQLFLISTSGCCHESSVATIISHRHQRLLNKYSTIPSPLTSIAAIISHQHQRELTKVQPE